MKPVVRRSGRLELWDDARGYGFIRADNGEQLFVHISAMARAATRPEPGEAVRFAVGTGRNGRPAAIAVTRDGVAALQPARPDHRSTAKSGGVLRPGGAALLVALLLIGLWLDRLPLWLAAVYAGLGLLSAIGYLIDKRAAEAGRWRVSEASLHGFDLVGGIAGGLLAQHWFRHKTAKPEFFATSVLIWVAHVAGLTALVLGYLRLV